MHSELSLLFQFVVGVKGFGDQTTTAGSLLKGTQRGKRFPKYIQFMEQQLLFSGKAGGSTK